VSSGGGKKRGKKELEEEHEDAERWLVSYADMMTVLVALFIVLYAISQVDEVKYDQLRQSLAAGFNGPEVSILNDGAGVLTAQEAEPVRPAIDPIVPSSVEEPTAGDGGDESGSGDAASQADIAAARVEYQSFEELAAAIDTALAAGGMEGVVQFRIDERGLVIGMITDEVFFASESAVLTPTSQAVVDTMTPFLLPLPNEISIEGHADSVPTARYASNWELSSDRATQVLRRMVEADGMPATRISAVGYGDSRPLQPNETAEGLTANRRVDLVVLSDEPERIRALLPIVPTLPEG
jgi:chemotaxis protein MotB